MSPGPGCPPRQGSVVVRSSARCRHGQLLGIEDDLRRLPGGEEAVGLVGLGERHPVGDDLAAGRAGPDRMRAMTSSIELLKWVTPMVKFTPFSQKLAPRQVEGVLEVDAGDRDGAAHADVAGDGGQGIGLPAASTTTSAPRQSVRSAMASTASSRRDGDGAEALGQLEPLGDGVDRDHLRRRRGRGGHDRAQPDRAGTDHRDDVAGAEGLLHRLVAGGDDVAGQQEAVALRVGGVVGLELADRAVGAGHDDVLGLGAAAGRPTPCPCRTCASRRSGRARPRRQK